jgi:FKBP-type peptidyl-prolyl cis-trans isomerase FklB
MRQLFAPAWVLVCLPLLSAVHSQDTLPQSAPAATPGAAPAPAAGAAPSQADYLQQVSYALGRNFAQNLKEMNIEVDKQSLASGIDDVLSNGQPKWTEDQLRASLQRFGKEMQQKAMQRNQQESTKNSQEAQTFLAENAKREGVQTTASGLQYRVIQEGDGASPTLTDVVRCNYRGSLINGTEFDSSAQHGGPAEFPVNGVIPGWTEALQKMKVGSKWQLFVPPQLAYGENPPGPPIEANSLLVFEIELLGVSPQ